MRHEYNKLKRSHTHTHTQKHFSSIQKLFQFAFIRWLSHSVLSFVHSTPIRSFIWLLIRARVTSFSLLSLFLLLFLVLLLLYVSQSSFFIHCAFLSLAVASLVLQAIAGWFFLHVAYNIYSAC